MIIGAGCTPVRGDFICSFLVRPEVSGLVLFVIWNPQMIIGALCTPVRGDFIKGYCSNIKEIIHFT